MTETETSTNTLALTREQWLQSAISRLRLAYTHIGLTLPPTIHVSVGFPSSRALSARKRVLGECWHPQASKDNCSQIYLSPLIPDGVSLLAALIHELIHACGISGHREDFGKPARLLGLTGKMTCTVPGPELTERLNALITKIGPCPHPALSASDRPTKKQSTRLLKAVCDECECIIRLSAKVVDDPGLPTCACGGQFDLELGD